MIRARLKTVNEELHSGGAELVVRWQTEGGFLWLDMQGKIAEPEKALLEDLGCHRLAISDASRDRHPPKVEAFEKQDFVLFRGISEIDDELNVKHQQLAFFIADQLVVSCHQGESLSVEWAAQSDQLGHLMRDPKSLALSLMHYSSGKYLERVLAFEEYLAHAEDDMLTHASDDLLRRLVSYRSNLRKIKRVFSYHERLASALQTEWCSRCSDELAHEIRDLYDRCERLSSLSAMYYEICGDLIDGYISISSHQLNNTMRILTIITAVFVPLSFLAGIYGMNFDYIPELKNPNGYFILLGTMVSLVIAMLWGFKRLRWF